MFFVFFGMLAFDVELMTVSLTNVSVMEGISPDIFSTVCVFKKSASSTKLIRVLKESDMLETTFELLEERMSCYYSYRHRIMSTIN